MKLNDVTRRHLVLILQRMKDNGTYTQANRALSAMKKFFSYCVENGLLDDSAPNPVSGITRESAGGKEESKSRYFEENEIKTFWDKIDNAPFSRTVQLVLKLVLLTGQRSGEVVNAEWSEVDLIKGEWLIPEQKSKNGVKNLVPLHDLSKECFRELKAYSVYYDKKGEPHNSRYVCQSPQQQREIPNDKASNYITPERPMLYSAINRSVSRHQDYFGLPKWTPHDLRRSVSTWLNKMKIKPYVVEKILNHKMQGVMGVYNQYDYLEEKTEALLHWQEKLKQIAADGKKVISLQKKQA